MSYREGQDSPHHTELPENIESLSVGGAFILMSDREGIVFGLGDNHRGQLGQGNSKYCFSPTYINMEEVQITQVSAGYQHSLLLDNKGNVYGMGRAQYSELGTLPLKFLKPHGFIDRPALIEIDNVKQVAAAQHFSVFLTEQGQVLALGKNDYGQCGRPSLESVVEVPHCLEFPEKVVSVHTGSKHCLAVGSSGTLYGWGSKIHGQIDGCRDGLYSDHSSPQVIELPSTGKVLRAKAAFDRSAAFLENGQVFAWGGEDSSFIEGENYTGFTLMNPFIQNEEIEDVELGFMHTLILTKSS